VSLKLGKNFDASKNAPYFNWLLFMSSKSVSSVIHKLLFCHCQTKVSLNTILHFVDDRQRLQIMCNTSAKRWVTDKADVTHNIMSSLLHSNQTALPAQRRIHVWIFFWSTGAILARCRFRCHQLFIRVTSETEATQSPSLSHSLSIFRNRLKIFCFRSA